MQATIVSIATACGVYGAYIIAENFLLKEALKGEAKHYWALYDQNGAYPLPNTNNMNAYFAPANDLSAIPPALQKFQGEYGRVAFQDKTPILHVSEHQGQRLYLLFKEDQVSKLAIFFGVAPLTGVLILIYLASWFTFRQSQQVINPVVQLAKVVEQTDVRNSDDLALELQPFHAIDADIDALTTALEHFTHRLQSFLERERSFTRDASHELRTPLAVLRGSLDVLDQQEQFSGASEKVIARMRNTLKDMEGLIETLLLLAREESEPLPAEPNLLNALIPDVIQQLKRSLREQAIEINVQENNPLQVFAPVKVLNIILNNILRNALVHGGSKVDVLISGNAVTVKDYGPGMDKEQVERIFQPFFRGETSAEGHGLGMAIIKRLCDRFGWQISIYSAPGAGTAITVSFSLPKTTP